MRKGNKGEMRIADSMVWLVIFQLIWSKSFLPSKQTDSQSNHFCKLNSHGHFFFISQEEGDGWKYIVMSVSWLQIDAYAERKNPLVLAHSLIHKAGAREPQNELQGLCEPKHGTQEQESGGCKSNFSVSLSHTCVSLEAWERLIHLLT